MREEKLKIIKSVFGACYLSGSEHLFICPFCNHSKKKLSINIDKSVWKCWVCDKHGYGLGYLVRRFGNMRERDQWLKYEDAVDLMDFDSLFESPDTPVEQRIDLPKGFHTLTGRTPSTTSCAPRRYLFDRGVTPADILKWKIGYCSEGEYAGRIIIPSFSKSGYVNYFIARSYGREWPRYKNPPVSRDIVFNELSLDWSKDVVIVEGVFDAIKAGNAIPLLGSTLRIDSKITQALVKNGSTVYLALDKGASRKSAAIARLLAGFGLDVYDVYTSDIEDVGAISKEEFVFRKKSATFIQRDNYLLERLAAI